MSWLKGAKVEQAQKVGVVKLVLVGLAIAAVVLVMSVVAALAQPLLIGERLYQKTSEAGRKLKTRLMRQLFISR